MLRSSKSRCRTCLPRPFGYRYPARSWSLLSSIGHRMSSYKKCLTAGLPGYVRKTRHAGCDGRAPRTWDERPENENAPGAPHGEAGALRATSTLLGCGGDSSLPLRVIGVEDVLVLDEELVSCIHGIAQRSALDLECQRVAAWMSAHGLQADEARK